MASFFVHTHDQSFFKAHFDLDGSIDKQNCRYRAADDPKELHQNLFKVLKRPCREFLKWDL